MKRYKLKKGAKKVIVTALLLIVTTVVYVNIGTVGLKAAENRLYELYAVLGWMWIIAINPMILAAIWDF